MKYVYYEAGSGEIKIISPAKEESSSDPYIEVEDAEIEHLHTGDTPSFMFYVKPLSRTRPYGKILKKEQASLNWKSINDWLYEIPKVSPEIIEFQISQNTTNKTITVSLDEKSRSYWQANGFFNRKTFPIAACNRPDPHSFVWVKIIDSADLMEDITFSYEGTDDLTFYTHRFFDCYYHEQHT
jgi:hypothetical protein